MKQKMRAPITASRPTKVPPRGTVVAVHRRASKDGRSQRVIAHRATGEAWRTVNLPHVMVREKGKPPVKTNDGYHYLPTFEQLVSIERN